MADLEAIGEIILRINSSILLGLFINSAVFCFIAFIFVPLYRLIPARVALMIVFSKAIGTLSMTAFQCVFYAVGVINYGIFWSNLSRSTDLFFVTLRLHILFMAINRLHCIFWPFHYNNAMTRKFLMKLCIGIWIISFILAALHTFLDIMDPVKATANYVPNLASNLFTQINNISIYGSFFLYFCIVAKMIWLKFIVGTWSAVTFEKDVMKICFVCFTSLTPFVPTLLPSLIPIPSSKIMFAFFAIFKLLGNTFGYCAEELSLIAINADFRQKIKMQFKKIFQIGRKYFAPKQNSQIQHENSAANTAGNNTLFVRTSCRSGGQNQIFPG